MTRHLKKLLLCMTGGYEVYRIFAHGVPTRAAAEAPADAGEIRLVDHADLERSGDPLMRAQAWYAGDEACVFAYFERDRIVGVCAYWFGARYRSRDFWPLGAAEANLMQVVTLDECRGRGIARRLIERSTADMVARGHVRLFARIWLTNTASIRAFGMAGWNQVGIVLRCNPLRRSRPMRLVLRSRGA